MRLARPLSRLSKNILLFERFFLQRLMPSFRISEIIFLVIWKEQVYWFLGERLSAAIVLIRGWKPLPQASFLVAWTYRISAIIFEKR